MRKLAEVKVSIIIPVYNIENYVAKCLDSILQQTMTQYEVIVIDDGSSDETLKVLRKKQQEFNGNMIILTQENSGQAIARNRGLEDAKGKYVIFIDGDDYIQNDYLEVLLREADLKNLDCVVCGYTTVDEQGKIMKVVTPYPMNDLFKMKFLACCSKLYRRTFLQQFEIKFPEGKIYEDIPFSWQAMHLTNKIAAIEMAGYFYLQRTNSTSKQKICVNKFPFDEYQEIINKIINSYSVINRELLEYSVCSTMTYFLFYIGRNNNWLELEKICDFAIQILERFFPNYYKNIYLKISNTEGLPITQRFGIKIFVFFTRIKCIKPLLFLVNKLGRI